MRFPRLNHGSALAFLIDAIAIVFLTWCILLITAGLANGDDQAAPPPRVLIVWHDPVVPNSRQFFDDLSLQGLGAELLEAGWRVERRDVRRHPLQAMALNIQAVPCFVIPNAGSGCEFWYGYDRERFREYFRLDPRPDQAATTTVAEQLTPAQLQQLLADQFDQQRAAFEQQLTATTEADQARQIALEQSIAQQQQQIAELERGNPETEQRLGQISQLLQQLAARDQVPRASSQPASAAAPGDNPPAAGGFLSRSLKVGGYTVTVLQALGVLGATSTGVGAIGVGLLALWRRRKASRAPTGGAPCPGRAEKPAVVAVEGRPLPQAIIPENTFVPYERDTFAEAFAWAETQVVKRFPGAVDQMEFLKSLINQHLASRGIKPKG